MKKYKNFATFVFVLILATTGIISLNILTTKNYVVAQSNSSSDSNENKSMGNYLTAISIVVSMGIAIFTYKTNESWKRRQYIEEKIKDFENKLETINVKKMLSAELQCIELFPFLEKPTHRFVIVKDEIWADALLECKCNKTLEHQYNLIDKDADNFEKQEPAVKASIRDNVNRFLDSLQQFEEMLQAEVIDEEMLKPYLEKWLDIISQVNHEARVICPISKKCLTPKEALLEYMGLLENTSDQELTITQKNIKNLVERYRPLSSLMSKEQQTNTIKK